MCKFNVYIFSVSSANIWMPPPVYTYSVKHPVSRWGSSEVAKRLSRRRGQVVRWSLIRRDVREAAARAPAAAAAVSRSRRAPASAVFRAVRPSRAPLAPPRRSWRTRRARAAGPWVSCGAAARARPATCFTSSTAASRPRPPRCRSTSTTPSRASAGVKLDAIRFLARWPTGSHRLSSGEIARGVRLGVRMFIYMLLFRKAEVKQLCSRRSPVANKFL